MPPTRGSINKYPTTGIMPIGLPWGGPGGTYGQDHSGGAQATYSYFDFDFFYSYFDFHFYSASLSLTNIKTSKNGTYRLFS